MLADAHGNEAGEKDEVAVDVGVGDYIHYCRDASAAYICPSERGRGAVHQYVHASLAFYVDYFKLMADCCRCVRVPYLILPLASPPLPSPPLPSPSSAPGTHWP